MKRSCLARGAALGTVFMLIACALLPYRTAESDASWTDSQTGKAEFVAMTVPGVTTFECGDKLGSPKWAELTWDAVAPASGVTVKYEVTTIWSNGITNTELLLDNKIAYNLSRTQNLLGLSISPPLTFDVVVRNVYGFDNGAVAWNSVKSQTLRLKSMESLQVLGLVVGGDISCLS